MPPHLFSSLIFSCLQEIIMFELNPIKTQLADLAERTNTLRGYL